MKVLVTGARGYVGRYAVEALRRRNIDVVVIGRSPPARDADGQQFLVADLLAGDDLVASIAAAGVSHLLHLAWYTEHGRYWSSPLNLDWVAGTAWLVDSFCRAGGRHVVLAGTCAEYSWSNDICREDATALEPDTLYGAAKDAARRLSVAVCREHGVSCAWGRIFWPYGTGEPPARLIPSLIKVFSGQGKPFGVNGTAVRDFLHVSDLAEGFATLVEAGADGIYNLGSGEPVAIAEMVRILARLCDGEANSVLSRATARPNEPPLLVADNRKLSTLGWRPRHDLETGLARTVREALEWSQATASATLPAGT